MSYMEFLDVFASECEVAVISVFSVWSQDFSGHTQANFLLLARNRQLGS